MGSGASKNKVQHHDQSTSNKNNEYNKKTIPTDEYKPKPWKQTQTDLTGSDIDRLLVLQQDHEAESQEKQDAEKDPSLDPNKANSGGLPAQNAPVSKAPVIDEDNEVVEDTVISYAEFPTHVTLREANEKHAKSRKGIPKKQDGTVLPFPGYRQKRDVFNPNKFAQLDKYADETPHELMRKPIDDIVKYLNKKCKTDMDKVRAYFRWLTTRDIMNLIPQDNQLDHEHAVLKDLSAIKDNKGSGGSSFTNLYADMCRKGNIQVHIIRGKVRTDRKLEEDLSADDGYENDWVAVFAEREWRFVDVHFAALKAIGEDPGDWELIDDNGKGYKEVKPAPVGITYECDEHYFLMNPEEFIYNHRPNIDDWQLLARPVTLTEFQEMAFLRPTFFANNLSIGDQKRLQLQSSDGEIELKIELPKTERCRFMYRLWHSTKKGKLESVQGFELSQFVLLEQRNGYLCCKVVFPMAGDYKLDLYARTQKDGELETGTKGNIQVHIIRGKVRTDRKLEEDLSADDGYENDWVAVFAEREWRFVDVHFAALKAIGEDPGDWELIDDNGKGYKEVKPAPVGITYECDEHYFLMNPEEFIYNHRPNIDDWQLLARPVTLTEFQEMAFLRPTFFANNLSIGDQKRLQLQSSDGEIELKIELPKTERCRFMYRLWHSTKKGKLESVQGFELSQFVLLEQRNGYLCCKVVFPMAGDYKLDLYARTQKDGELETGTYSSVCTYIMHCDTARQELNALPRNTRNEWGFSHEMYDLGLVPITHPNAIIETDDGYIEIKFRCSKDPVDCLVELRGLQESKEELQKYVLFRQNEGKELIIHVKLPKRGWYALDLYGKPWGTTGTFPQISTYLLTATTGVHGLNPYPQINSQQAGQRHGNIPIQLSPLSHKESIITYTEESEMELKFATPVPVDVTYHLYFWMDRDSEERDQYTFRRRQKDSVSFLLRFTHTGTYTFELYAKPKGTDGSCPHAFTYVIFVENSNPGWVPFPKQYDVWEEGCEVEGLSDGDVEAGGQQDVGIKVPHAADVAVITEGNEWIHLKKDEDEKWRGGVAVGGEGTMKVCAKYDEGNSYSTLLECQVKSADQLEEEKQARFQKQKEIREAYERRQREKENQREAREKEFEEIKQALQSAIKERDVEKLRVAIARVEKNNYTKRLEKEYEEAKQLKKTLEKIARLRQLVLTMDQKMMAVIRSYGKPPPIVHATMRAAFLLLGNGLKETKDWKKCQGLSNTILLNKRVRDFDIKNVSAEYAKKTRKILDPIRVEDVQASSEGAATFYVWALGMSEEVLLQHR